MRPPALAETDLAMTMPGLVQPEGSSWTGYGSRLPPWNGKPTGLR